ncbi:MAG TPA: gliding motility protein GldN [Bacteroidales bacterium]|nr:gliding motility protein GldN [Bacteroidales bacterium]HPO64685.1 gliding motility protein GldN [Bacteroidales bacterium]
MKRKVIFMGLLSVVGSLLTVGVAQDNRIEVYVKEHIPNKRPVPYAHVREADVMWSKIIWRVIDLREKQNFTLYYPTRPIDSRMNLITLLLYGIDNEGVTAYSTDDPLNEFKTPLTKEQVDVQMGAKTDTIKVPDPNTGELVTKVIQRDRQIEAIKQIMIKEKWYFDKQLSTMQVRVLGICPILVRNKEDQNGNPTEEIEKKLTFWVYYPEVRNLLANHEVYNRFNDAQYYSFDDLFTQRRFSSFIFKESNVYDNRPIGSYTSGIETLYESERIKESIFKYEHDLWEY